MVHSSNLPIYADLGLYNLIPQTKASMSSSEAEDYLISLEDLLDRGRTETVKFNQYDISAVPFKEESTGGIISLTSTEVKEMNDDSLTCSRLFLVNTIDRETDTSDVMVVTMLPDKNYLSIHNEDDISYTNKPDFSGIILYSDIDGTFIEAKYYGYGPMACAIPLVCSDSETGGGKEMYISIGVKLQPQTRSVKALEKINSLQSEIKMQIASEQDDGRVIECFDVMPPSICIASANTTSDQAQKPVQPGIAQYANNSTNTVIQGGASGTNRVVAVAANTKEKMKYNVRLFSSNTEWGVVSGEGDYLAGSIVTCSAISRIPSKYCFDRWVGDLFQRNHTTTFKISNDILATAYFMDITDTVYVRPCWNSKRDFANPLSKMQIAPTKSGNKDNGLFWPLGASWHRAHGGIDLAADVGTPIYAPSDGIISKNKPYVTEQPERHTKQWPNGYSGDVNDAGNRFYMDCTINGEKVTLGFFHLQAGNPIAVNPRTGKPFAGGDQVFRGEVIGYVGRTGNAYNIKHTHLHLVVRSSSGKALNPEFYINGSLTKGADGKLTSVDFRNIICDEEKIQYDQFYY